MPYIPKTVGPAFAPSSSLKSSNQTSTFVADSDSFGKAIKNHHAFEICQYLARSNAKDLLRCTDNHWFWIYQACKYRLPENLMRMLILASKEHGILEEILSVSKAHRDFEEEVWLLLAARHDLGFDSLKLLLAECEILFEDEGEFFRLFTTFDRRTSKMTCIMEAMNFTDIRCLELVMNLCVRFITPSRYNLKTFWAQESGSGGNCFHIAAEKELREDLLLSLFNFSILQVGIDIDKLLQSFNNHHQLNCLGLAITHSSHISTVQLFIAHFTSHLQYRFGLFSLPPNNNDNNRNNNNHHNSRSQRAVCARDCISPIGQSTLFIRRALLDDKKCWHKCVIMYRDRFGGLFPPNSIRETSYEVVQDPECIQYHSQSGSKHARRTMDRDQMNTCGWCECQ